MKRYGPGSKPMTKANQRERSRQVRRDTLRIISGQSEHNAQVKGRIDENGEKIPDGMLRWSWRMNKGRQARLRKSGQEDLMQ